MITPEDRLKVYREAKVDPASALIAALKLLERELKSQVKKEIESGTSGYTDALNKHLDDLFKEQVNSRSAFELDVIKRIKAEVLKNVPKDGKDGKNGKDGKTPTKKELLEIISPLIPGPRDGHKPTKEELTYIVQPLVMALLPDATETERKLKEELMLELVKLSPTGQEIVKRINSLPINYENQIDAVHIRGLPRAKKQKQIHGGGSTGDSVGGTANLPWITIGFDGDEDYVVDGVSDNVEIQQAFDAVKAAGGGQILIKRGTYDIRATIWLQASNVIVMGEGKLTKLRAMDSLNDIVFAVGDGIDSGGAGVTTYTDNVFRDFYIDGNQANQTGGDDQGETQGTLYGLFLDMVDYCLVYNVRADNCNPTGINLAGEAKHNKIIACTANDSQFDGIFLNFSSYNVVEGCVANGSLHGGIFDKGGSYNVINGNDCNFNSAGLIITTNPVGGIYTNNSCSNGSGVLGPGGSGGSGIGAAGGVDLALIANNICNNNDFDGMRLSGMHRCIIKGNHCWNNGQFGGSTRVGIHLITTDGVSTLNNIIEGNFCGNTGSNTTQQYGIRIEQASGVPGTANNNTVQNNYLIGNTVLPLTIDGDSNVVRNNYGLNPDQFQARGNVSGGVTITRVNGNVHTMTLTGNITLTLTNGTIAGDTLTLIFTQDGTGSRLLTMAGSNWSFAQGKLTLSTTAAAVDVITFAWNGTLWREISRSTDGINVDASVATIPTPYQVTSNTDGQVLFKFNTDRAWQFEQQGTGASTNLVLKDTTGNKHFLIRNNSGTTILDFFPASSGTTAALSITPGGSGLQEGLSIVNTKNSRNILTQRTVTNADSTNNNIQMNSHSTVSDGNTYTKSGAALIVVANNTVTSGTLNDTSTVITAQQLSAIAAGTVLEVDNRGTGASIIIKNNTTEYFKVSAAGVTTIGTLGGVLKGSSGVVSGAASLDDLEAPTVDFSMDSNKITDLEDPTDPQDAASKAYVDAAGAGLSVKTSCRVATTANITLSGTQTIDGVSVVAGDRVLVKDQSTAADNGIYVCAAGAWSRSTDADTDAEVVSGMYTFIVAGTANASTGWILTTADPITVGSTSLSFAQFSAAASITAGAGLTKTGSTLDVVGTADRITANADSIDIASTYVGQTSITTLGTVTTGTWNASAIGAAYGGTGLTTIAANGIMQGNGTSAVSTIPPGAAGTVLVSDGTAASFDTLDNSSLSAGTYTNITGVGTLTAGTLGSGFTTVSVALGGTGQTSVTAAFDALAPTTTQGDMIYYNGSDNVRLAKGTALQQLRMNSAATAPEWFTSTAKTAVELSSDVAFTATTFSSITGMSFSVTSGTKYRFFGIIVYTTTNAARGIKVSLTAPATTILAYHTRTGLSTTAGTAATWESWQSATDSGAAAATSISTASNILVIEGYILPSASGTVQLRAGISSNTGSPTITVKAGSYLEVW